MKNLHITSILCLSLLFTGCVIKINTPIEPKETAVEVPPIYGKQWLDATCDVGATTSERTFFEIDELGYLYEGFEDYSDLECNTLEVGEGLRSLKSYIIEEEPVNNHPSIRKFKRNNDNDLWTHYLINEDKTLDFYTYNSVLEEYEIAKVGFIQLPSKELKSYEFTGKYYLGLTCTDYLDSENGNKEMSMRLFAGFLSNGVVVGGNQSLETDPSYFIHYDGSGCVGPNPTTVKYMPFSSSIMNVRGETLRGDGYKTYDTNFTDVEIYSNRIDFYGESWEHIADY